MENVVPLLKRKEKHTQKMTLMHSNSKVQTYKLDRNTSKGR
jgi:hypothetical protein